MGKINYINNPLKQVICRFDFKKLLSEEIFSKPELFKAISANFQQKLIDNVIMNQQYDVISENHKINVNSKVNEIIERSYMNNDGTYKLIFSRECLLLIINKYSGFDYTTSLLTPILKILKEDKDLIISRFGMRYINIFNKNSIQPLKSYFIKYIGELLSINTQNDYRLSRSILYNEYISDNIRLTAQYGKPNNNYPSIINPSDNDFTLDYDAYVQGDYYIEDILNSIYNQAHELIQKRFESDITDKLRMNMNGQ